MSKFNSNINKLKERQSFYFKLKLSILIIGVWFVIELIDNLFSLDLESYGLKPKSMDGLKGILTFPFLHGDWQHLFSNSSSAFVLFTGLFVFHEKRSFFILTTLYLSSGALLWLIGGYGTNVVGASGLIYAVAFFLFVSSLIIKNRNSMALSFFIILMYGSMIWGVMPFFVEANVSWEGHLAGAIVGVVLAFYEFRNYEAPPKIEYKNVPPFFERYPLE